MPGRVAELAAALVRIDTSNPPGNERAAVELVQRALDGAQLDIAIRGRDPERPNLVARLEGRGAAPPLVMHGHLDVVPVDDQDWEHDPFAGEIVDGTLWGRGAHDMKGPLAMMITALLCAAERHAAPPGDVILAAFADEECGSGFGARYVVEEHPELLAGARYAIGEFGGVPLELMGERFYPIQVAEKQACRMLLKIKGRGGHGSVPVHGEAMARLGGILRRLDRRLPVRLPAVSRLMIEEMASALPDDAAGGLRMLLDETKVDQIAEGGGARLEPIDAMLRNTATATTITTGTRTDAIPATITVELDGRVVPGSNPDELLAEVSELCGEHATIELLDVDEPAGEGDLGLFGVLSDALRAVDPAAKPLPMLLPGCTDGRWLARLGIHHYGFIPMRVPPGFPVAGTLHSANERIPVAALEFGAEVLSNLLERFGDAE